MMVMRCKALILGMVVLFPAQSVLAKDCASQLTPGRLGLESQRLRNNDTQRNVTHTEAAWIEAIERSVELNQIEPLKDFLSRNTVSVNRRSVSGFSLLQLAVYFRGGHNGFQSWWRRWLPQGEKKVLEWIIGLKSYDFSTRDSSGLNDVEWLLARGEKDLAQAIQKSHPEVSVDQQKVAALRKTVKGPHFVPFRAGRFLMGDHGDVGEERIAEINQPFHFFSTETTNDQWAQIVQLSRQYLSLEDADSHQIWSPSKDGVRPLPVYPVPLESSSNAGAQGPVTHISPEDIDRWVDRLNRLAKLENARVQQELMRLFPGYQFGDEFRLPTSAEWEYAARLGGLAVGRYPHGNSAAELSAFSHYYDFGGGQGFDDPAPLARVDTKRPVMMENHALYGLLGNGREVVSDGYHQHSLRGHGRMTRGGTHLPIDPVSGKVLPAGAQRLVLSGSDERRLVPDDQGASDLTFRLVLSKK